MVKLGARKRPGFTFMEIAVTLAVIAILGAAIFQCIIWSLAERARLAAQQAAVELAANVLEGARARPFDKLDQDWAAAQTIPAEMDVLLPDAVMVVKVEAELSSPHTRRITVEVGWRFDDQQDRQSVQLTSLLSARSTKKAGGGS